MAPDVGLFNMFIVNTGYRPDSVLPDEEQSAVLNIALDNATVKEMLSNRNYTNSYVHTVGTSNLKGGTNIRSEYPAASFMIINRSGTSYNIQAAVDIKNNKVIEVNALGFPLPPEY